MNLKMIGNGNITSTNFNASYILNEHILIDAPAGINKQLKLYNININDIDTIIITHLHGDHFFDLPFILFQMYAKKRKNKLMIIGPSSLKQVTKKLLRLAFPYSYLKILYKLKIIFLDASKVKDLSLKNLTVTSVKVKHSFLKDPYGYLFKNDNKILGVTGDIEKCNGLEYILKNSDVIVVDVTNHNNTYHLKIDELNNLLGNYPKLIIIPTHYPDSLKEKLVDKKNFKLLECGEQFKI